MSRAMCYAGTSARAALHAGAARVARGARRGGRPRATSSSDVRWRAVARPAERRDDVRPRERGAALGRVAALASRRASPRAVALEATTGVSVAERGARSTTRPPKIDDDDRDGGDSANDDASASSTRVPGGPASPPTPSPADPPPAAPERPLSPRRLFLATLASVAAAETAGQAAERALLSEPARLRMEQKRQIVRGAIQSAGLEPSDPPRAVARGARSEATRAGAIAALAAVGAIGSRVIARAKRRRAAEKSAAAAETRETDDASSEPDGILESLARSLDSGDEDDACLTGATCAPNWSEEGGDGAAESAESAAASEEDAFGFTSADYKNVAVTVAFSACYGGLFQPHWFNVLNSYDWSAIILPDYFDARAVAFADQLRETQALRASASAAAAAAADAAAPLPALGRVFLETAGGFADPSLVSSVSLSLDAAGQTLAPLLVNQLVAIPALYWPSFFLFAALAEGRSAQTALQTLHRKLPGLMKANLAFWIPAQGFQFSHVPAEQQAVYVACAGVVWNGILATITAPKAADEERGEEETEEKPPDAAEAE